MEEEGGGVLWVEEEASGVLCVDVWFVEGALPCCAAFPQAVNIIAEKTHISRINTNAREKHFLHVI